MKVSAELFLAVMIAAVCVASASSTIIMSETGKSSGGFLRIGVGARAIGLGEAYAAVADDADALYWNPAGLCCAEKRQAMFTHNAWYEDINHDFVGYAHPLPDGQAVGVSITYLGTSFEKRAGDTDAPDSKGTVRDVAAGISYGRRLFWRWNGGITAKYISSKLDTYDASSFGVDVGLRREFRKNKWAMGVVFTNLLGRLKYVSDAVPLGQGFDLGFVIRNMFFRHLQASLDLRSLIDFENPSINTGLEYALVGKTWSFIPRAGFKAYDQQMSYGFGVRKDLYRFDYAFVPHEELGNSHRVSLSMEF